MQCSCKKYERYGYPCHHLFHVLNCKDTSSLKKEWIHIRWSKEYLLNHYSPDTEQKKLKIYQLLYENHPKGIQYNKTMNEQYPIYKGFENMTINTSLFNSPDVQFMSKVTRSLWIQDNATTDEALKQILRQNDANMISKKIELSQEQNTYNDMSFDYSDGDVEENNDVINYTEKVGLLKRAHDLCQKDYDKHKELYSLLSNFVTSNEINNKDNDVVMQNRKKEIQ